MPGENQVESMAQIVLHINDTAYRVMEVDTTTEVDIEMVYGNQLEPSGWSVNEVSYSGSLSFNGDVAGEINPALTADDGVTPVEGNTLTITHMDGSAEVYEDVFMTQVEYTASEGETTETSYEWVAMSQTNNQTGGNAN